MLSHLLFSISALIFIIIFTATYFSYKNSHSLRSKEYICMIFLATFLSIIEIVEGVSFAYNFNTLAKILWYVHTIIISLYIAALFYYYLLSIADEKYNSLIDLLWDNNKILSIKNLFTIIFIVISIISIVLVEYVDSTKFLFYTNDSLYFILLLYVIYFLYNMYIVYLKTRKNVFDRNDYIVLFGVFLLLIFAIIIEYMYPAVSIYSTVFTLVLILIYYFKENEDLIMIDELQKSQLALFNNNNLKLKYLHDLISDLESPLHAFTLLTKELENCSNLTDEALKENLIDLNYISNNLLSISKNQTISNTLKYRIDKLVLNIEKILEPTIKEKSIKVEFHIDQNLPSLLMGDRISIHRIISNLLVNAIDNTDVGKVVLNITGERQRDNILLHIKISDSGMGIKEEDFDKVFDLDFNSSKNANLALTKSYVDSLNGDISFESNYASGSIFYVNVVQKIINDAPISQVPMKDDRVIINDCANKKVLLIDNGDNSSNRLINILKKYNLTIIHISSGREGINMIKEGEEYDLIIIDESVKDISYLDIARLLKYLKDLVKIPLLVCMTSQVENENDKSRLLINYDDYLSKPVSLKSLDKIIKRISVNNPK